ncbi:MAG TPA: PQQ-dependent sugar dehydrogenase [Gemmatimonadales bacterium]
MQLQVVATGLQFPLLLTAPLTDLTRLFVVEKRGVIRIIRNGQLLPTPFLDIRQKVSTGSEQGLLGLTFHPSYSTNGVFVINYTDTQGDTRIASLKVSANPDIADPASEEVFLFVDQPFDNHNGGHVTFGPFGFLFIGLGDGGSAGDPGNRAQDLTTTLGKLLRYQVDDAGRVTIPTGNPLVGNPGVLWGIWSWGLRNPWRFSFDRLTSDLYVADVGQNQIEEVNVVKGTDGFGRAINFGWRIMEGTRCFNPSSGCEAGGLRLPVLEYTHAEGCSVTGGHVYRGQAIAGIVGHYFYSDFCSGWIRSFRYQDGAANDRREWPELNTGENVSSFGEDAAGELYFMTSAGRVYKLVPKP